VVVKDQSTPSKKNFARVLITVIDSNDHAPEFSSNIVQGRVFETTAVGTSVLQLLATDKDHGENAAVSYQIISGKFPVIVTTIYWVSRHNEEILQYRFLRHIFIIIIVCIYTINISRVHLAGSRPLWLLNKYIICNCIRI